MLSLAPPPEGYDPDLHSFAGTFTLFRGVGRFEHAGHEFYERYEKRERKNKSHPPKEGEEENSNSSSSSSERAPPESSSAYNTDRSSKGSKKNFKEHSSIHGSVRKAIEDHHDLYATLEITTAASPDDIKKAYKRLILVHHPDKVGAKKSEETDDTAESKFLKLQHAFEVLADEKLRRQYDSTLPFDDQLPSEKEITPANFFEVCRPAFQKESQWAARKPVPQMGDMDEPIEQVRQFYRYWGNFESWRDYSNAGEYNLEEAQDRDERRWMQKENWKVVCKLVKQERQRVLRFVSAAEARDPRLIRERELEKQRKIEAKAGKKAAKEALAAEQEKKRLMFVAKREEEERKKKEEYEKKRAAKKELDTVRQSVERLLQKWQGAAALSADLKRKIANINDLSKLTQLATDLEQSDGSCRDNIISKLEEYLVPPSLNMDRKSTAQFTAEIPSARTEPNPSVSDHPSTWDTDSLSTLAKALAKFPGGTMKRWDKIADMLGGKFTTEQVIHQAKHLNATQTLRQATISKEMNEKAFELSQKNVPEDKKKINAELDTRIPNNDPQTDWTTEQQSALEAALARHGPNLPPNARWKAIAEDVGGKTAKECLQRYKQIREAIQAARKLSNSK